MKRAGPRDRDHSHERRRDSSRDHTSKRRREGSSSRSSRHSRSAGTWEVTLDSRESQRQQRSPSPARHSSPDKNQRSEHTDRLESTSICHSEGSRKQDRLTSVQTLQSRSVFSSDRAVDLLSYLTKCSGSPQGLCHLISRYISGFKAQGEYLHTGQSICGVPLWQSSA